MLHVTEITSNFIGFFFFVSIISLLDRDCTSLSLTLPLVLWFSSFTMDRWTEGMDVSGMYILDRWNNHWYNLILIVHTTWFSHAFLVVDINKRALFTHKLWFLNKYILDGWYNWVQSLTSWSRWTHPWAMFSCSTLHLQRVFSEMLSVSVSFFQLKSSHAEPFCCIHDFVGSTHHHLSRLVTE